MLRAPRRTLWWLAAAATLHLGGPGCSTGAPSLAPGAWRQVAPMAYAHADHRLTRLPDGRVLLTGGTPYYCHCGGGKGGPPPAEPSAETELFDPTTGTWTWTGWMAHRRQGHSAVLLPDGKVLVCCGQEEAEAPKPAELFDPATGTWSETGTPRFAHRGSPAVLLPTGKVLVAGGAGPGGGADPGGLAIADAELFDPATGTWTATSPMAVARALPTATLLPSGEVLLVGGMRRWLGTESGISEVERYDPVTGTWSPAQPLGWRVALHAATALRTGEVLVAGGTHLARTTPDWTFGLESGLAAVYDPAADRWREVGPLHVPRFYLGLVTLPSGRALAFAGLGEDEPGGAVTVHEGGVRAELFDPATETWIEAAPMPHYVQFGAAAALLADGDLLVSGGWVTGPAPLEEQIFTSDAERFCETMVPWSGPLRE